MNDPQRKMPPPEVSGTYSTDEIIAVFEHLMSNEKTWEAYIADHGLDPVHVSRTLKILFGEGGGLGKAATQAFVLGLQFGAMRLDPVEYDPGQEKPCDCLLCQMRRAIEGEGS